MLYILHCKDSFFYKHDIHFLYVIRLVRSTVDQNKIIALTAAMATATTRRAIRRTRSILSSSPRDIATA